MEEKENNKLIRKGIFENLIIAIAIILYFILINFLYSRTDEYTVLSSIKIVSVIVLFLSIAIFEIAYHKDSGKIAINGIEVLVLAIQTLTIWNAVNKFGIDFQKYIVLWVYVFAIYYVLKSIIFYTNEKRKYLKSLSDIHEIVMKEPTKKEAKKRENK